MENINQSAPIQNDQVNSQVPNNNEEFAEKGPLFNSRLKRRFLLATGIFVTLVAAAIGGIFAYNQLNKPPELVPEPPKLAPDSPEIVLSDTPQFAYIKNDKNIWISNINGEEKFSRNLTYRGRVGVACQIGLKIGAVS